MKKSEENSTFGGRLKARNIRRHPIEAYRRYVKWGIFSRLPRLPSEFQVEVPPNQDFVVRLYGRGSQPIEVKCQFDVNGGMTVLAHRSVEIELIEMAVANLARVATAEKQAKSKSK